MTVSAHGSESLLFLVLIQLTLMIAVARLFNGLARKLGQPGVVGEILAGLMLGPSLFGHFFPGMSAALFSAKTTAPITIISQIGLILLMFQIGIDFAFGHLRSRRFRLATAAIACASVSAPLALGIAFGRGSASVLAPGINPMAYSLFCGVAVAITAVPILGRILREYGLTRHPIGVVAISAAAINDVTGWSLLAGISAFATSTLSVGFVAVRLAELALFVAGCALLKPLSRRLTLAFPVRDGAIPPTLLALVLCLIFVLGLCTNGIGIFTIFGGFAAGLLFHDQPEFVEAWRRQVGQFVLIFFLPVFFTFTGLRTNVLGLSSTDAGWLALLLALSILGKILPVYAAGRLSGFNPWESAILGSLMNTRALMELIVLNIGFDLGVLPQRPFTMLVIMAVTTTIMTGPLLQILLARMGHTEWVRVEA